MIRVVLFLFLASVIGLSFVAGLRYSGLWAVYLSFAIAANALLLAGFRRGALYFDTFIGIFLWLGFWLKLSIRVAFLGGEFSEPVGAFDASPQSFDAVLLVATASFSALLLATFVRERYFSYPAQAPGCADSGLFLFYRKYRSLVVTVFLVTIVLAALSNVWLGIYQRGMVTGTVLPFGLNGVYKWALQFGLASISALIVRFEIELGRRLTPLAIIVPVFEGFMSNTAMLSRGMVLNASAIGVGGLRTMLSRTMKIGSLRLGAAAALFCLLFVISVLAVNYLRIAAFNMGEEGVQSQTAAVTGSMTTPLFIDRWVGIEGLMAVASSDIKGWDLWRAAWQERFQEGTPSLYDQRLIASPYLTPGVDRSRNHFVSLPGMVAFLYYPGSMLFLCASLLVVAWSAAFLEYLTYRFCGGNWILCALFAQVIAFRYASFGYVPGQSYLLFGSLVLNGALILLADRLLRRVQQNGVA
ncbi:hypothetical protein O4G98_19275 [Zoogloeaceae bacterium G21618-S1]|nr:hypothetical protein [Zoogloeaceae bacterium G21618-S1]